MKVTQATREKFTWRGDEFVAITAEEAAKLPPARHLPVPSESVAGRALREGAKHTRY